MESASKLSESRRVKKPISKSVQNDTLERERETQSRPPAAGRSISELPSGPGTRAMRQAAVIQMQRTHGNAHVMRQLQPTVQRQEEEAPAGGGTGPSAISGSGGRVDTGGSGVEVTGGTVNVHSGVAQFDGIVRASTIMADSVVASSYTPGAGNIW